MWEITCSLHRLQTRRGRRRYGGWYRAAREALTGSGLDATVRRMLIPLLPRAAYFPDFLTPAEAGEGLDAGLEAVLATPNRRVLHELDILDRVVGAPPWARRLVDGECRQTVVRGLRAYHDTVIAPACQDIQATVDADRVRRARAVLDGGVHGLLASLCPVMRWQPPVLVGDYQKVDMDVHLDGRGLLLIPSYFCWNTPVALVDPDQPQVLVYPLQHDMSAPSCADRYPTGAPLAALLGATRADILHAAEVGATTSELARLTGVSAATASRHATVLRDTGLLSSHRHANTVIHALTPLGASLLRSSAC